MSFIWPRINLEVLIRLLTFAKQTLYEKQFREFFCQKIIKFEVVFQCITLNRENIFLISFIFLICKSKCPVLGHKNHQKGEICNSFSTEALLEFTIRHETVVCIFVCYIISTIKNVLM